MASRTDNTAADASFLEHMPVLELHRSNVLRLETEELLKECRLDLQHVKWHSAAQHYISELNTVLETLSPSVSVNVDTCPLALQSDKPPVAPLSFGKGPLHIEFHPSTAVGMTTRAGNAKQLPLLECTISLPKDSFHPKDYLRHRYFHKRNLVLWHVLKHFHEHSDTVGTVEWYYAAGNERAPVILLTPPTSSQSNGSSKKKRRKQQHSLPKKLKFQVQISVKMASDEWMPPTRLFPNRSNLGSDVPCTPIYNTDLARDCVILHDYALDALPPSLQDALILLKVWCLQRGFLGGHDSLGNVKDISCLLVYLLRTKHVTPRMAPLEVITAWWKFVSTTVTASMAVIVPLEDYSEAQTIQESEQARLYAECKEVGDPPTLLECFRMYTDGPVLLNSKMTFNVWGNLSPSFMKQLQAASTASLECLHNATTMRPFSYLFLQEARFYSSMDAVMRIPLDVLNKNDKKYMDTGVFDGIARIVVQVLEKALGDRVKSIRILTTGNGRIETSDNPSQIPKHGVTDHSPMDKGAIKSPLGDEYLVLGLTLNSETCHRVVDRGPPAEDVEATKDFIHLWGKEKAQLRRFKDGAIVHAVVWNTSEDDNNDYIRLEGDDKSQGGIVERIVRHVLDLHFIHVDGKKQHSFKPQFVLRNVLSLVDGVATPSSASPEDKLLGNATAAFKSAMSAFCSLSEFLRQNSSPSIPVPGSTDAKTSRLGAPLAIDAVEPLSPSLRYSELFPPLPQSTLGGPRSAGKKVSGVAPLPILIQIRFGLSSKWPTDLKAMAAAKTAMLIQLADGIESMKHSSGFEGPILVTPSYMDLGYKGYAWRIIVRADPELNMLRKLQNPSPEAVSLLRVLTREHVVSAMHHSMIHGIHTMHPSSGSVVRLAKRWTAAHLLSDLIPFEAIELLVAKVYTSRDIPLDPPTTVVAGFMRFLHLLASHNWSRHPLVVDPHGHMREDDHSDIVTQFERARGPDFKNGPPMYIVSPNDRAGGDEEKKSAAPVGKGKERTASMWTPTFTQRNPEWVVLSRAAALAKRSHDYLMSAISGNEVDWTVVFHETPSSFKSYSALLRVDSDFVVDKECSSTGSDLHTARNDDNVLESSYTRSMRQRSLGPKALRRKVYRNLNTGDEDATLYDWKPVEELVQTLRKKFGSLALFFYNDLAPEVIGMLWRPTSFVPQPFTVMHSEYVLPVDREDWKLDSLVIHNTNDILRELSQYTADIVVDVKVLDDRSAKARGVPAKRKRSASGDESHSSSSSNSD